MNLAEFVAALARAAETVPQRAALGVRDGAEAIQMEARAELGNYQPAVGPFEAWPALAEKTQEQRLDLGFSANDPLLRTGELRDAIEIAYKGNEATVGVPDRTVGDGTTADPARNIGDIAIDMEMGTDRAPPRPFLARAAFVRGEEAAKLMAKAVGDAIAGKPYERIEHEMRAADDIPF